MGYYKIKNVTDTLAKRHAKVNTTQNIDISDSFKSQLVSIAPSEEFLLESNFLPISLHKLRSEGLINIIEMDKNSFHKLFNEQQKKDSNLQLVETNVVEEKPNEEKSKRNITKFTRKDS